MAGDRGSVMVHVLVISVIAAVISAGLIRMMLMRYQTANRSADSAAAGANAKGSYLRLMSAWNGYNGGVRCASVANSGYTCSPASISPPGGCNCTCTPTDAGDATVVAYLSGGQCVIASCTPPFSSCP